MNTASSVTRTSNVTNNECAFELIAPVGKGVTLLEMGLTLAAATASTYKLGRPAAIGVTPTTPAALALDVNGTAAASTTAVAWGTKPTTPTTFLRQLGFPATIGSHLVWTFYKGLVIPAGKSIVLWNGAANGVIDVYVIVDEGSRWI